MTHGHIIRCFRHSDSESQSIAPGAAARKSFRMSPFEGENALKTEAAFRVMVLRAAPGVERVSLGCWGPRHALMCRLHHFQRR